ncbi:MAG: protein-disulfide reductase DsbD family protein [Endozoicomonas sp. (ex Botrylloides leachii)]|nr:protein-disulfide reductase DsbD family protein [Endozoicomonas sp. (ex Botrylloides leachii)]
MTSSPLTYTELVKREAIILRSMPALTTSFTYWLIRLVIAFIPMVAQAQQYTTGWQVSPSHPPVSIRFILTGQINLTAKTVESILQVKLDGDWKTYWKSPGGGGIPPKINWSMSSNIKGADWHWPAPKRFELSGIEILGYQGDILFPITLHVKDINKPVNLDATLSLSSCTTLCVLIDYPVKLDFIPHQLHPQPDALYLYNQGISKTPSFHTALSLESATWNPHTQAVALKINNPSGWTTPDIFVDTSQYHNSGITFSAPKKNINGTHLTAIIHAKSRGEVPNLVNKTLSLVVSDQNVVAAIEAPLANAITTDKQPNLFMILVIALLGGLILNIMPCVLPVLGMKLSTVLAAEGVQKYRVRQQFLAAAAGILASFWLLAGFLIVLKLSGQALGWGIQFQNPYFLAFMVLVTALFSANILGFFEINLPTRANTWLAAQGNNSLIGYFIQGMFATVLATPCSAPFLGTAVTFALGANTTTLIMVFTALALGMAIPWLLIAAIPILATWLPKPGRWLNRIKLSFGIMMLLSSLWLLSLLENHIGIIITSMIATAGLVLFFVIFMYKNGIKRTLILFTLLCLGIAFTAGISQFSNKATPYLSPALDWQPLNTAVITKSVMQGKTVFVDVTADWCITCKANKFGVLLQEPVYSRLQQPNIIRLKGDWTKPSDKIASYLQHYGRYAVPFNSVYGPGAPNGIVLPIILTSDAVIQAINKASIK